MKRPPHRRRDKPEKPVEKRHATLADKFIVGPLGHPHMVLPSAMAQVRRGVMQARKFVFDEAAARRVARVVAAVPDLLVREHEFARTPFDLTWIEYPAWAYWDELRDQRYKDSDGDVWWNTSSTADHTVGYLVDHYRVNTIAGGIMSDPDLPPDLTPLQYRLHTEWPEEDQAAFAKLAGTTREDIMAFMWGSTFGQVTPEQRLVLRDNNVVELLPFDPRYALHDAKMDSQNLRHALRGAVGDVRTVVAMLLMLNRPRMTRYLPTLPNIRGFYRAKVAPFMSHTVVTVDLDAGPDTQLVSQLRTDGSEPRRWHEVEDHFCHDRTAREYARIAGCIHDFQKRLPPPSWDPWPADRPYLECRNWICAACGGKRWRRVYEHGRGTAEKGFVQHDAYAVGAP